MSRTVISVEGLGKKYRLGASAQPYKTLRESLTGLTGMPLRAASRLVRRSAVEDGRGQRPEFWALKDVSFEVKHGEVMGIIGRNGAGKSTLLKLLSQITEPTEGRIRTKGRISSLLEVGTGFHPELTGRENALLNGAILGMSRADVMRKFDEIMAFAEVEKFIDTQVKHYSSGMYLRLAFAVAAHLEPEILIVDEVLAVGDSAFQKKCIGKMGEVSGQGRTVLFVSHNMQAVTQLTNRCIILASGRKEYEGPTAAAVRAYENLQREKRREDGYHRPIQATLTTAVMWAKVHTSDEGGIHHYGKPITFEFALHIMEPSGSLNFSFQVVDELQRPACHFWLLGAEMPFKQEIGTFVLRCEVPKMRLYQGTYTLTTWLSDRRSIAMLESLSAICPFEVTMDGLHREEYDWKPGECVYIEDANWTVTSQ